VIDEVFRQRVVVNVGCGPRQPNALPAYFDGWQQLRVDVDPAVEPDILADLIDLSPIKDGTADAVWASHCVEHLYTHQVPAALSEFRRILNPEGFCCVMVPDLMTVANYIVADRLHDQVYQSPAGPVSAHDIFYGFGAAIADGRTSMAHRCGFTPTSMQQAFARIPFGELMLRRRQPEFELVALARVAPARDDTERIALMDAMRP
jgi:SAM-dependent methyltransferase